MRCVFLFLLVPCNFFKKIVTSPPVSDWLCAGAVLYWFAGDLWALQSAWEKTCGLLVSFVMCIFPGPLWGFLDSPHSWMSLYVLFFQIVSCEHFFVACMVYCMSPPAVSCPRCLQSLSLSLAFWSSVHCFFPSKI